jgi:hypothetical protein
MKIARNMEAIFVTTLGLALALSQFSSNAVAQVMPAMPAQPVMTELPALPNKTTNASPAAPAHQTVVIHAKRLSH